MLRFFVSTFVSLAMVFNPLAVQSQAEVNPLIKYFEAEANKLDSIPAWQTDLAAFAALLPNGVDPVRKWVQNQTRNVPYAGLLKGAEGVFWEREGNSLDRALLLGKMLEARGETVRIGRYNIGNAAKESLLANTTATPRRHNEVSIPASTSHLHPTDLGLSDENWNQTASAIQEAAQALPELQDAMFGALTRVVQPKLRALRSNTPAQAKSANHDQAIASLLNYWVAEVQIGGEWQPLILDGFGDVDPELEWSFSYDLDEVPELYHHSVVFEVRAVLNDGTELELVSHNRSASAYESDTVNIYMTPVRKGGTVQRAELVEELERGHVPKDIQNILESALEGEVPDYGNVRHWLPVISTNKGVIQTLGVDTGGATVLSEDIEAAAENDAALGTVGLAAVVVDVITLFDKEVQSRDRRELLSYEPSGEFARVAVHSAYDVQTRRYSPDELAYRLFLASTDLVDRVINSRKDHTNPTCLACRAYGFFRWEVSEPTANIFLSSPNVVGLKKYHISSPKFEENSVYFFDIVRNAIDVIPHRSVDPFPARLHQGFRDSVAETLLLSLDKDQVVSGATISIDRPEAFEVASGETANSYLTESLRKPLNRDLNERTGYLLTEDADLGAVWWRIDTQTGELLSRGSSGEGIAGLVTFLGVILFTFVVTYHGIACAAAGGSLGNCLAMAAEEAFLVAVGVLVAAAAGVAAGVAGGVFLEILATALLVALTYQMFLAVYKGVRQPIIDWVSDPRRDKDKNAEEFPETPAPMCVDLASILPNGLTGSIGTDGGVCGLSCGQLKSLGSTAFNACKNYGVLCDVWDDYYVPEIPRCCSAGVPICQ